MDSVDYLLVEHYMKILDTYWFNGGGIVRVEDPYDGIKYYIKGLE